MKVVALCPELTPTIVARSLPNSISGSPIYFSVENLNTAHTSACVLKFAVFVNVTGRIPQLDHRSISQYKTSIPPCVCTVL